MIVNELKDKWRMQENESYFKIWDKVVLISMFTFNTQHAEIKKYQSLEESLNN